MTLGERKELINKFYIAAGGTPQLAHSCGVSANSLRVGKHRGVLYKRNKYELMAVAKKIGFTLPDEIFEAAKPEGV